MQLAGVQVQRLARLEGEVVQQQRREGADVARVGRRKLEEHGEHLDHPRLHAGAPGFVRIFQEGAGAVDGFVDKQIARLARQRDEGGKQRAQARLFLAGVDHAGVAAEQRRAQSVEQAGGARVRAEPGERLELRQRDNQLGLVVRVLVVAARVVQVNARRLLAAEPLDGLRFRRVRLQRQRRARRKQLEQERQVLVELVGHALPKRRSGIVRDDRVQAAGADCRRRSRVRTEPQLRLRAGGGRRGAAQVSEHGARAPRVGAQGRFEELHRCLCLVSFGDECGLPVAGVVERSHGVRARQ